MRRQVAGQGIDERLATARSGRRCRPRRSGPRSSRRSRRSPRRRRRAAPRAAGPRRGGGPSGPGSPGRRPTPRPRSPAAPRRPPRPPTAASAKAAKNASPSVLTTTPPWPSIAARSSSSWRATSAAHAADPTARSEPRRALDVGEQERDGGTGRECHQGRPSWSLARGCASAFGYPLRRRGVRVVDGAALEKRCAKAPRVRIPPSPPLDPVTTRRYRPAGSYRFSRRGRLVA